MAFQSSASLLTFCLLVLLMTERCIEVSRCNYGFSYFSFQFSVFTLCFEAVLLGVYTFGIVMSFLAK